VSKKKVLYWVKRGLKVAFAAALTWAVLTQGTAWWSRRMVDDPLASRLSYASGVLEYKQVKGSDGPLLYLSLGEVEDLAETCARLERIIREQVGQKPFSMVLVDARDRELGQALDRIHLEIEEAVATGRFTALRPALEDLALREDLDMWKARVQHGRLYLQVHRGERYLYLVREMPGHLTDTSAASESSISVIPPWEGIP